MDQRRDDTPTATGVILISVPEENPFTTHCWRNKRADGCPVWILPTPFFE